MSLDLDTRQRAMLQEMGVHVWLPEPVADEPARVEVARSAAPVPRDVAHAPPLLDAYAIEKIAINAINTPATALISSKPSEFLKRVVTPPTSATAASPAAALSAVMAEGIEGMDWTGLAHAVADCQACKLCTGRRAPVFGRSDAEAPRQSDWLVVGDPPDDDEERGGEPFAGQAGQLLDNMLKAVGVSRRDAQGPAAYVTNIVKCRPAVVRIPSLQELATCENYLRREIALVQPKVIVAMGRFAAQTLLRDSVPEVASIPLGKLRGLNHRYQGIPVVVTYPPSYLLRTQQDKARAWADLCWALAQVG